MKISVVQEDPDNLTIVLPVNPADLTPDQLRGAAGGAQDTPPVAVTVNIVIDGGVAVTTVSGVQVVAAMA